MREKSRCCTSPFNFKQMNVLSVLRFIKKSLEDIMHPHPGVEFLKQARKKILAWF